MHEETGLFKEDLYPLLTDRLIFPIHNSRGILVGFSGRTTDPQNSAKYINSPESSVFSKKKLLYGLHFQEKSQRKRSPYCRRRLHGCDLNASSWV